MNEGTRVALVTGAGRGIGLAIAARLARDGYRLHLVDRDPSVDEVAATLASDTGVETTAHRHDLTDVSAAPALVERVTSPAGRIDVLVNSAGVSLPRPAAEITEADWDPIFNINAKGLFFLTRAVVERMRQDGGGSVINLSSISGKGWSGASSVAYAGSKAAIIGMSRALAREYGPYGVRVNSICPGITRTPMMENWATSRAADLGVSFDEFVSRQVSGAALTRPSTVDDIAAAATFLASPESGNVTGQSLNVDGGTVWD